MSKNKSPRYVLMDMKTGLYGIPISKPRVKKWLEDGTDFYFGNGEIVFL